MKWLSQINRELYRRRGKRFIDISISLILIILLLPLMLAIVIAIFITSRGPVIYRRRIVGIGGEEIYAYKFRTMVIKADEIISTDLKLYEEFKEKHKLENDFRVTPIGVFLRKFSLDEIPQFFNVLKGEMSLIGPRMIHPDELVKYGPHKGKLLSMKPSITGYWQVNGRQNTSYEERVRMDLYYIENCSFTLDMWILFITPIKILQAEGAQ